MDETLRTQALRHASLLADWQRSLAPLSLEGDSHQWALIGVDLLEGFSRVGPLSSPRVAAILPPAAQLVGGLLERGMPSSQVLFLEDHHPQSAEEFAAFPPHCISATQEAEPAAELRALAAWPEFTRLPKNSVASHSNPALDTWLERCPARQIVAVGDVTDLCLYALALHLITRSQARSLGQRIIVPENAAQTWDAPDHPGDLYHLLFLHQLARLGVQVVSRVLL